MQYADLRTVINTRRGIKRMWDIILRHRYVLGARWIACKDTMPLACIDPPFGTTNYPRSLMSRFYMSMNIYAWLRRHSGIQRVVAVFLMRWMWHLVILDQNALRTPDSAFVCACSKCVLWYYVLIIIGAFDQSIGRSLRFGVKRAYEQARYCVSRSHTKVYMPACCYVV